MPPNEVKFEYMSKLPRMFVDSMVNGVSSGGFFMTKLIAPAGCGPYMRAAPPRTISTLSTASSGGV